MSLLKKILIKILSESNNDIIEMAFDRKKLISKIEEQSYPLFQHIMNILYFQTYSDWDQTITDIVNYLNSLMNIKKHKKFINKNKMLELLLIEPFFDDEEPDEYFKKLSKSFENSKNMKVKYIPTFNEVENIYKKLIELIYENGANRNDIRKIIKVLKS